MWVLGTDGETLVNLDQIIAVTIKTGNEGVSEGRHTVRAYQAASRESDDGLLRQSWTPLHKGTIAECKTILGTIAAVIDADLGRAVCDLASYL